MTCLKNCFWFFFTKKTTNYSFKPAKKVMHVLDQDKQKRNRSFDLFSAPPTFHRRHAKKTCSLPVFGDRHIAAKLRSFICRRKECTGVRRHDTGRLHCITRL